MTRDEITAVLTARLEDCQWMAETGECLDGAARRLGMSRNTLEKWLDRNAPELLPALIARQPRDHNRLAAKADKDAGLTIGQLTGKSAERARARARNRNRSRPTSQEAA